MSRAEFYRLVSAAIRRVREETAPGYGSHIVHELSRTFAAHNQAFDAERFARDCDPTERR
jgi:hypothetical protein